MVRQVIILSGPISSGKSALGDLLVERYGATRFKTNQLIKSLRPDVAETRKAMQAAGEALDRNTNGRWVRDALVRELQSGKPDSVVVVDAVRIKEQIDAIREAYGRRVIHIHLTASEHELARRYHKRKVKLKELPEYRQVRRSPTEHAIEGLASVADVVIKTDLCRKEDVLVRAAAYLDVYPRTAVPLVDVLVGAQYGSEGKGNIASYIAPEYKYLVRVGGPNAGHKVYGDPPYTFHHLPSGTRHAETARLLIGPGAVISVRGLLKEILECDVSHDRLVIDEQAMIIEPKDVRREKKRLGGIASTAQGVGEATARRVNDRANYNKPPGFKLAAIIPLTNRSTSDSLTA